jgi:hypothetical protein
MNTGLVMFSVMTMVLGSFWLMPMGGPSPSRMSVRLATISVNPEISLMWILMALMLGLSFEYL